MIEIQVVKRDTKNGRKVNITVNIEYVVYLAFPFIQNFQAVKISEPTSIVKITMLKMKKYKLVALIYFRTL